MSQLIKLNNKPKNFEYSTTFQTKNNKTLYAKIIVDFKNFPSSIRTPFVNLMIKWGQLYPNDCFQRLRRYLKSIQVPYITKYPLINGSGHLYVSFPYISEEKRVFVMLISLVLNKNLISLWMTLKFSMVLI